METLIGFGAVVIATLVALFGALALQALLLRGIFALMAPATADRRAASSSIEHGTRMAARAFAKAR
jgi:hypothetical protein